MAKEQSRTRKIIIIRGNSGAGKSTVVEFLRSSMKRTAVLCPDYFYHQVFKREEVEKQQVYESIKLLSKYYSEQGYSLIIEGLLTGFYKFKLDEFLKKLSSDKDNYKKFFLLTDIEVGIKRNRNKPFLNRGNQQKWYDDLIKTINKEEENAMRVDELSSKEVANAIKKNLEI